MGKSEAYDYLFKIVLIGNSGVGKTNLLTRFCKNDFQHDTRSTIGVEFAGRTVEIDGKLVKAAIWDTAGQERFRAMGRAYYRGALGALIVYDVTKRDTFDGIYKWLQEARDYSDEMIFIGIVGNKSDMSEIRQVKTSEAKRTAEKWNVSFYETSALASTNVEECFQDILMQIYKYTLKKEKISSARRSSQAQTIRLDKLDEGTETDLPKRRCAC